MIIKLTALLPCLNEEKTLAECIEKAKKAFENANINGEVLVADNGSIDNSVSIAEEHGARVIHVKEKGYGAALIAGINSAKGKYIVMADADCSYDWLKIPTFYQKLEEGYDLVMGNRFQGGIASGAMPPLHKYLGNPVLSTVAKVAFNTPIGDFHCGMRGFKKEAILKLGLQCKGMEFATEMIALAAKNNLKIKEIPTTLDVDKRDRPPHLQSWRDGWRHLKFILMYAPDHLFLFPGLLVFFIGVLLLCLLSFGPVNIAGLYLGIHFLALASLLVIVGATVLVMGILAKLLVARRFVKQQSKTVDYIKNKINLESMLQIALVIFMIGFFIDAYIFFHWINNLGASMSNTVHSAFFATTLMALGTILGFGAFLISLSKEVYEKY